MVARSCIDECVSGWAFCGSGVRPDPRHRCNRRKRLRPLRLRAEQPRTKPLISRHSRHARRSTSCSMCPASRSISAPPRAPPGASTCAALPAPRAMSSSTARARALRRKHSTSRSSGFPRSRLSAWSSVPATCSVPTMRARARCSTSSSRSRPESTRTSPPRGNGVSPATSIAISPVRRSIRRGPSTINLSAGTGNNKQLEEGTDTLTDPATGELLEFRRKHNTYFNRDPYLSRELGARARRRQGAFRLNARWQPSRFDLFQSNRVTPSDGSPHDDNLHQHYRDPVVRAWRRRHSPARRRRDQVRRARHAAQAPRLRRLRPAGWTAREQCAGSSAASSN